MNYEQEYRGIAFVRISDLPDELRDEISSWVNGDALIKIKTENALYRDCLLTKDFEYWYHNIRQKVGRWHDNGLQVQISPN